MISLSSGCSVTDAIYTLRRLRVFSVHQGASVGFAQKADPANLRTLAVHRDVTRPLAAIESKS